MTEPTLTLLRTPEAADFTCVYDDDHTYDFFEDEQGDGLWAFGEITDEEFVRQANDYFTLCDVEADAELRDVDTLWGVIKFYNNDPDFFRVQIVDEGTPNSALIKIISR